jgi:hypothetical protein
VLDGDRHVRRPIARAPLGRGGQLVGIAVGLLLLGVPPASASHVLGRYEGTLATGSPLSFGVSVLYPPSPTASVTRFVVSPPPTGRTELGQECRPSAPPDYDILPVVDHAFSDTTPPTTVSGSFSAPLSASGTFRITTGSWFPPPGEPPLGSTCDTGPLSWTASCTTLTPAAYLCSAPPDEGGSSILPSTSASPTFRDVGSKATVSRRGRVTLPLRISCPLPGAECLVTVAASARLPARPKQVKVGGSGYVVNAGGSDETRFKLTKKGRRLLERLRRIKAKIEISVTRLGAGSTRKTVTVRLRAPRRTS